MCKLAYAYICTCFKTTVLIGSCENARILSFSCYDMSPSLWPPTAARQTSLSITNSWSLLKFMSMEFVMPSNHLILCHPLLIWPSIFPTIKVFSNELVNCIRWPKHWSFSISPSNEYSGLISFGIDFFNLLDVQGTLKNLLQHHSTKPSIIWHSASLWSNSHIHT